MPCVVVLMSGRPMIVAEQLPLMAIEAEAVVREVG